MGHSPAVLAREVVGMDGLRPIDDIVTLDGETGGGGARGCGGWGGGVVPARRNVAFAIRGTPQKHKLTCTWHRTSCPSLHYEKRHSWLRGAQNVCHTTNNLLFNSALHALHKGLWGWERKVSVTEIQSHDIT